MRGRKVLNKLGGKSGREQFVQLNTDAFGYGPKQHNVDDLRQVHCARQQAAAAAAAAAAAVEGER
jgi:hypothetical protein